MRCNLQTYCRRQFIHDKYCLAQRLIYISTGLLNTSDTHGNVATRLAFNRGASGEREVFANDRLWTVGQFEDIVPDEDGKGGLKFELSVISKSHSACLITLNSATAKFLPKHLNQIVSLLWYTKRG
jgi:hypothetical protein